MYAIHVSDGKLLDMPGRAVTAMIGGKGGNLIPSDRITLGMTEVAPHVAMDPHVHIEKEEIVYVLEGEGEVRIGDVVEKMYPNVAVVFPENIEHAVANTGDKPLKFVFIFNPTHDFDGRI